MRGGRRSSIPAAIKATVVAIQAGTTTAQAVASVGTITTTGRLATGLLVEALGRPGTTRLAGAKGKTVVPLSEATVASAVPASLREQLVTEGPLQGTGDPQLVAFVLRGRPTRPALAPTETVRQGAGVKPL